MKLTKLKPFCLNYFCVLRNRPTRPWPSVGRFAACWILKISRRLANRAAVNWNARAFKFVLLGNLVSLLVTKMIYSQNTNIYLTYHDGEFWPLKWEVYSEAVHRKFKFKVPSTNICNTNWWHRSPSVCDELLKFTDFSSSNVRLDKSA